MFLVRRHVKAVLRTEQGKVRGFLDIRQGIALGA